MIYYEAKGSRALHIAAIVAASPCLAGLSQGASAAASDRRYSSELYSVSELGHDARLSPDGTHAAFTRDVSHVRLRKGSREPTDPASWRTVSRRLEVYILSLAHKSEPRLLYSRKLHRPIVSSVLGWRERKLYVNLDLVGVVEVAVPTGEAKLLDRGSGERIGRLFERSFPGSEIERLMINGMDGRIYFLGPGGSRSILYSLPLEDEGHKEIYAERLLNFRKEQDLLDSLPRMEMATALSGESLEVEIKTGAPRPAPGKKPYVLAFTVSEERGTPDAIRARLRRRGFRSRPPTSVGEGFSGLPPRRIEPFLARLVDLGGEPAVLKFEIPKALIFECIRARILSRDPSAGLDRPRTLVLWAALRRRPEPADNDEWDASTGDESAYSFAVFEARL